MDIVAVLTVYAIGTLFGMLVGSKWGFERGVLYGITTTIEQLDNLHMLNDRPEEIITKIKKIQEHQENQ